MSRRVCQTQEQLGTNTRNGVANTVPARQGTTMNHMQIRRDRRHCDPKGRYRCSSILMQRLFEQPVEVDHRRQHCGPRGRHSGNPKLDGVTEVAHNGTIKSKPKSMPMSETPTHEITAETMASQQGQKEALQKVVTGRSANDCPARDADGGRRRSKTEAVRKESGGRVERSTGWCRQSAPGRGRSGLGDAGRAPRRGEEEATVHPAAAGMARRRELATRRPVDPCVTAADA
uniref:Uncharacterized protein n=1 Tax=Oryza glumipatula TaxID=40148 RepID=A0A0E0AV18_9ORYZ